MDSRHFDELTKALATSTTRRKALQRIGGTLAGSLLAAWPFSQALAAGGGNSACAHFCASVFGAGTPAADQCTSDAAHGTGLCYQCGPAAPATHPPLCGQVCCGNGQGCCSGTCTNLNTTSNCGTCGNTCTTSVSNATAVCTGGGCDFVCNSGYKSCNDTCIPNNQCCGDCPSGQICQNGTCITPICPNPSPDACNAPTCGGSPNCFCEQSVEGGVYCSHGGSCAACGKDSDCGAGKICVSAPSCCGYAGGTACVSATC